MCQVISLVCRRAEPLKPTSRTLNISTKALLPANRLKLKREKQICSSGNNFEDIDDSLFVSSTTNRDEIYGCSRKVPLPSPTSSYATIQYRCDVYLQQISTEFKIPFKRVLYSFRKFYHYTGKPLLANRVTCLKESTLNNSDDIVLIFLNIDLDNDNSFKTCDQQIDDVAKSFFIEFIETLRR